MMKRKKIISRFAAIVFCAFLFAELNADAQNTNQNQNTNQGSNSNSNNNSGNRTGDEINSSTPATPVTQDSVNRPYRSNGAVRNSNLPGGSVEQQRQQILRSSGQNQVIIPPNASGPDTNIHRVTMEGNFTNSASDTTLGNGNEKRLNTTLTDSVGPERRDTLRR